jgi:hypothetical protein
MAGLSQQDWQKQFRFQLHRHLRSNRATKY